jgi:SAM-dependent methyltransferase
MSSESARWRRVVRDGYDAISHSYRDDEGRSNPATGEKVERYGEWVSELAGNLKPGSDVLDLGCGAGVPATRLLVEAGFDVLGLDFSTVQIARARSLVPGAEFVEADMATWDAKPESFDAVVSFYALIHLPLEDQKELLPRIRRWLRTEGVFLGDRRSWALAWCRGIHGRAHVLGARGHPNLSRLACRVALSAGVASL